MGFPQFLERKVVKDAVSVVVHHPEVIRLAQVPHDHVKMFAILSLDLLFRNLIGNELINAFNRQLVYQLWIRNGIVGGQNENGSRRAFFLMSQFENLLNYRH